MALVQYSTYNDGSARSATTLNAMLSAWAVQAGNITPPNLRDEGCDVRTVRPGAVVDDFDHADYTGAAERFVSTGLVLLAFATGEEMRCDNGGAGWDLGGAAAGASGLRIRFGCNIYAENNSEATGSGSVWQDRSPSIYFEVVRYVGGVPTYIGNSLQEYGAMRRVAPLNDADKANGTSMYRDRAYLPWALGDPGAPIESVEVWYRVESGAVSIDNALLTVEPFYR